MLLIRRCVVGVQLPSILPWEEANLDVGCRTAIEQAFQLASDIRVPVTLVTVLPPSSQHGAAVRAHVERDAVEDRRASEQMLSEIRRQLIERNHSMVVNCVIRNGLPWEEILRAAGSTPDTLVLCGCRRRNTSESSDGCFAGITGRNLLQFAPGPVWIVKPRVDESESGDLVAATDLGPESGDVLHGAVSIARILNARLHVVHAVQQDAPRLSDCESRLHEELARTDYRTLPFGVRVHVALGAPEEVVARITQDVNSDLVVIGTTSCTDGAGRFSGSTVPRLLSTLKCSMLALRSEGFRPELSEDFWIMQRIAQ